MCLVDLKCCCLLHARVNVFIMKSWPSYDNVVDANWLLVAYLSELCLGERAGDREHEVVGSYSQTNTGGDGED